MIPGIFVAAGEGRRFGSQKLISIIEKEPVIIKGLRSCIQSDLNKIIVVLGYESEKVKAIIEEYFPENEKLIIMVNPDYRKGIISSLNAGLRLLGSETENVMMILADMPFVRYETINKLIGFRERNKMIIPEVNGVYTHPRIIPESLFAEFFKLERFTSGKDVIRKNRGLIKTIIFDNVDEFLDIDTKKDLEKL